MSLRHRPRKGRGDLPLNAEINVTSLIDVAFTLLVVFIIIAPALEGGIEVRLPQADVPPITSRDQPFIVSILDDGTVVVGETPVTPEEFDQAFPQLYAAARPSAVYIRGDSIASWARVYAVMATVRRVADEDGVPWAMVGDPERIR